MKFVILSAIVATAAAAGFSFEGAEPGQTGCGTKSNPESAADSGMEVCEYYQTCINVDGFKEPQNPNTMPPQYNKESSISKKLMYTDMSFCLNNGNFACYKYSDNSNDSGTIVGVTQCTPSQKCCNGACCDLFKEACMVQTKGGFTYGWNEDIYNKWTAEYENANTAAANRFKWGFLAEESMRKSAGGDADGGSGGRDYMTDTGAEMANPPMMCQAKTTYMNTEAGFKVIYIPVVGVLITLWAIMAVKSNGKLEKSSTFAPCTMLVCALLGWFSFYQGHYAIGIIVAVATACAPANWTSWVLFFQLITFWWFCGGTNFFIGTSSNSPFLGGNFFAAGSGASGWPDQDGCTSYFNFFSFDSNMKWWSSGDRTGWGYCSYEWVGFQVFLAVTNLLAFFVMILQTVVRCMNGGGNDGSFTDAIVTRQTSKV